MPFATKKAQIETATNSNGTIIALSFAL
ncbi:hypothetical protein ALTERO38_51956 [Alteromonas sp. 38]|nr:hypothetical protein ALTERO38_51956 [Alteromonas sp. 38]